MKRRFLLIALIALMLFTLGGCASVTYRLTKLYEGGYRQTLTVELDEEAINEAGTNTIDEIKIAFQEVFESYGYTVAIDGLTLTAVQDFDSLEEVEATILNKGYILDENSEVVVGDVELPTKEVQEGILFSTTTIRAKSVFYSHNDLWYFLLWRNVYSKYGIDGSFRPYSLDITYEYATIYKSVYTEDGAVYKDGKYYVNTFKIDRDNQYITLVQKTPNKYAWYMLNLSLAVLFAGTLGLIAYTTKAKVKPIGGINNEVGK
jgi:hypothetical protein